MHIYFNNCRDDIYVKKEVNKLMKELGKSRTHVVKLALYNFFKRKGAK